MTHRVEDYSLITDPEAKEVAALQDFRQWIGDTRYDVLIQMAADGKFPSLNYFRDTCSIMLEVEGFPVEAFIRKYLEGVPEQGQPLVVPVEEKVEYAETGGVRQMKERGEL